MISESWEEGCDIRFHSGLSTSSSSILCTLPSYGLVAIYYRKKLLWWGLRYTLTYRYSSKSLGVVLILCPFNRIMVVGFPLHTMTFPVLIMITGMSSIVWSWIEYNNDDVDDDKQLANLITFVPLLITPWVFLLKTVVFLAHSIEFWVTLMVPFFFQKHGYHLLALWKLASSDEASKSVVVWFFHVFFLTQVCGVLSNRFCRAAKFLRVTKSNGNSLKCLGPMWPHWITTQKQETHSWYRVVGT